VHSRALVLRLDTRRRTAELVHSYAHRPELLSTSQGNTEVLPDGHVFVGWGSNDYFTEFARDGKVLLDGRFGTSKADSYRAYRLRWVGHPVDRPAVAARRAGRRTAVYASWNGATDVKRWRVLAGARRGRLHSVKDVAKNGFETRIPLATSARYVKVQALDERGRVLRTSAVARSG